MKVQKPHSKFSTIDDYIASQPAAAQASLKRVRQAIRRAVPTADEAISYNIPSYKLGGSALLYFAGWKAHYSLYPVTSELLASLVGSRARERASTTGKSVSFEVHKGTVRFPLSQPVPSALITEIAKLRVAALGATPRTSSKKAGATKKKTSTQATKKKPKKSAQGRPTRPK